MSSIVIDYQFQSISIGDWYRLISMVSIDFRKVRQLVPWTICPRQLAPRSSDSAVDKRTKNNLYDVKSWVHIFSGSFGSVVDKRMRGQLFEDRGWVFWGVWSRERVVQITIPISISIDWLCLLNCSTAYGDPARPRDQSRITIPRNL